jgi:Uma2 family endonuclease
MSVGTVAAERAEERRLVGDGRTGSDAGKLLTVEEFLALCERPEYADTQLELDEGRLVVMPPAGSPLHGRHVWSIGHCALSVHRRMGQGSREACNDVQASSGPGSATVRAPDFAYLPREVRLRNSLDWRSGYRIWWWRCCRHRIGWGW